MEDQNLTDRTSLQELKASYFRYLDTKQWASWRELFTDDMVFYADEASVPTTTEAMTSSGDEFVEMVSTVLVDAVTVHQGHMPEIHIVDNRNATGSGRCSIGWTAPAAGVRRCRASAITTSTT